MYRNDEVLLAIKDCDSSVVNVITPNDDEKNDILKLHFNIPVYFSLYNRWGKLIYSCDSCTDVVWDGKVNDKIVSSGVYYYLINGLVKKESAYIQVMY